MAQQLRPQYDEYMKPRQLLKENKPLAIAASVSGVFLMVLSWITVYEDTSLLLAIVIWLLTTSLGKGILFLVGWVIFFGYWVGYPWAITRTRKSRVKQLCDKMNRALFEDNQRDIDQMTMLGGIVLELRDVGAFRGRADIEGYIDLMLTGETSIQASAVHHGIGEGTVPFPASSPKYQSFSYTSSMAYAHYQIEMNDDKASDRALILSHFIREINDIGCKMTMADVIVQRRKRSAPAADASPIPPSPG